MWRPSIRRTAAAAARSVPSGKANEADRRGDVDGCQPNPVRRDERDETRVEKQARTLPASPEVPGDRDDSEHRAYAHAYRGLGVGCTSSPVRRIRQMPCSIALGISSRPALITTIAAHMTSAAHVPSTPPNQRVHERPGMPQPARDDQHQHRCEHEPGSAAPSPPAATPCRSRPPRRGRGCKGRSA